MGLMLGGQAGAFLAHKLGIPISPETLLRRIRQSSLQNHPTPRVLGVDDWAFKKGHHYGTLLVDLERHQPIDLLPDRKSETLADWLKQHPGVEIISRDRALSYAEGAREGAPHAVQVADRWHLLKNLGEAVERFTSRNLSVISKATAKVTQCQLMEYAHQLEPTSLLSSREPSEVAQCREQRYARYNEVRKLYQEGVLKRDIARITGISEPTIRKYIRAENFPERARVQLDSQLEPYIPYIQQRWLEGCENATQLWHEVKAKGYPGKVKMVERYIRRLRKQRKNLTPQQQRKFLQAQTTFNQPNSRRVARWLLKPIAELKPQEQKFINYFLEESEEAKVVKNLGQEFQNLIQQRQKVNLLDKWLRQALQSQISEIKNFAVGIQQDYSAVAAALKYEWSNGQVEGQINKLKLIKRQMYGRAKLDLLKARMLYTA
jgi:transposase